MTSTHSLAGSDSERQSVGDPGHCERCAQVGHVRAHPDLGCGDVGCTSPHSPGDPRDVLCADHAEAEPDGYVLIHHRAMQSSTCYFGPFATRDEALDWLDLHPDVRPLIVPTYKTVDWSR